MRAILQLEPGCIKPRRAYAGDAGLDLAVQATATIQPGATLYLPSGVSFKLGRGWCVQVITRSSTFKRGLVVIPTVIDAGYTGSASVIVSNPGSKPITVQRGERLAQAVLTRYATFDNENEATAVPLHKRGDASSGSSGR